MTLPAEARFDPSNHRLSTNLNWCQAWETFLSVVRVVGFPETSKTIQAIAVGLGCHPEKELKIPLLKKPCSWDTRLRGIGMDLKKSAPWGQTLSRYPKDSRKLPRKKSNQDGGLWTTTMTRTERYSERYNSNTDNLGLANSYLIGFNTLTKHRWIHAW